MYYGSDEFNNAIENTQGNALKTRLKFSDEEIIELISSMRYYGGSNDTDDLSIGNIAMAYVEVSAFTNKMLTGREFLLESGVKLSDGTYEYAPIGYFTVQTPSGDYDEVSFTAYDRMVKFEKVYSSSLTYPTDSAKVLNEICTMCGVELATPITDPITITENLKGYTCREVLSYIAGIHGFFACIDRFGKLNLRWYSDTPITKSLKTVWAFEKSQEQYEVEKVEVAKDSETSFTSGNGIITLHHSNPYATQEITNSLYSKLGGYAYMPAEVEMLDDIRLDPWDVISVTYYDGIAYLIPCMSITHDFGATSTTITAVGKTSVENEYRFTGPTIQYLNRMATDLLVANRVIATKVDAEYVQAHAITTDNLDAIQANIKNAVIEEVEADFVRTENLEAIQAEITEAVIGDLEADFATIEQLNTVNANIEQLDTGIADINTLIFGSAGGTVIQTEFSNSVIAQLGDAQIKSAMIESVSAGKITAGDIITNNVRVMSEDGSLIISDETMQISDGTRVRVQIGKDASNDYSINIWDANGNLMFSKGGITDSAIKEAIIRNDMVSDTANISASKLNIESLFSEINGSTNTIKATKIYLDDSSQTLDVAFTSMNNTVDNLQSVQTSQGTQISAIQGQITSKIWEQDITTAVNNIEIGARNLIKNSNFSNAFNDWLGSAGVTRSIETDSKFGQCLVFYASNIGDVNHRILPNTTTNFTHTANTTYTLSFYAKASEATQLQSNTAGGANAKNYNVTTEWQKFTHIYTTTKTGSLTFWAVEANKTIYLTNIKLELGNKATDWTPAPEDIESKITTLNTNYSSLNQTVNSISTTVGSHTTSLNGLSSRVTSAESNITQLSTEIDLRVKKDGVIAAINLSSETALIQASKINLVGAVTITSLDSSLSDTISNASSTATEALNTANNMYPLIKGTQTSTTGSWTGKAPFSSLVDGQKISYTLPYAGSGNATLNLTLSNGTTTGALPVYYNANSRVTTQYSAGAVITLTYRKNVTIGSTTYTGWWTTVDSNTYDRTRQTGSIKASSAIVAGNIVVGNSSGYHHLKTGGAFDISYPILYAGLNISSGSVGNNNYLVTPFSVTTTQSITLTAYKAVYIKGKLSGSTFTPVSTAPLTQAVPTSDDGYYYILLGTAYGTTQIYLSAEHPIYRYKNGAFKTTAQIAAEIAAWAYNNNATYIDGGNIYANTITADKINVADLFAQDILATGSITGVTLNGVKGFIGNWEIADDGLRYEDGVFSVEISPPTAGNGNIALGFSTYDEGLESYVTEGYVGYNGKGYPYIYMYEYMGNFLDVQQIDATTVTANFIRTKAGADLDEINSNLKWKYWRNAIGTTIITLPEEYEELILEVERGESIVRYSIPVTWAQLKFKLDNTGTELYFRSGQYTTSTNYESVTVAATTSYVNLVSVYDSGRDVTTGSELRVFYR